MYSMNGMPEENAITSVTRTTMAVIGYFFLLLQHAYSLPFWGKSGKRITVDPLGINSTYYICISLIFPPNTISTGEYVRYDINSASQPIPNYVWLRLRNRGIDDSTQRSSLILACNTVGCTTSRYLFNHTYSYSQSYVSNYHYGPIHL